MSMDKIFIGVIVAVLVILTATITYKLVAEQPHEFISKINTCIEADKQGYYIEDCKDIIKRK
jgi:uncharacterized membrane protein